jgi:hypothetical protein
MKTCPSVFVHRSGNLLTALLALALLLDALSPAQAQTYHYIGADTGVWGYNGNWKPTGGGTDLIPAPGDNAELGTYPSSRDGYNVTVVLNYNYTHALNSLTLDATNSESITLDEYSSSYNMKATTETVGQTATGTYEQLGGANTISGTLTLGLDKNAAGIYTLSGGTSSTVKAATEVIGDAGTGTFTQSGGSNTITDTFILGNQADIVYDSYGFEYVASISHGNYNLQSGSLKATGTGGEVIGLDGIGTFTQTGGTNTVTGNLALGSEGALVKGLGSGSASKGTYILSGGSLKVNGSGGEMVGAAGVGIFQQSNGTTNSTTDLTVAAGQYFGESGYSVAAGSYTLSSAYLNASGTEQIGGGFTQTGNSINTIANSSSSALDVGGFYNLEGGVLVVNFGGGAIVGGSMNQSGSSSSTVSGKLTIGGKYDLSGGTLQTYNGEVVDSPQQYGGGNGPIPGTGIFNQTGGSNTTTSLKVDSGATYDLSSTSGPASLSVTGDVTNDGTIKVTAATATFGGTFTNNGVYTSDPSTQNFNNLKVSKTGYLQGGAGDVFNVGGSLTNKSTQASLFNITSAQLTFEGDVDHDFTWAGVDLGDGPAGYTDNFAIGTLEVQAGGSLTLLGEKSKPGGGIYVTNFELDGGLAQIKNIIDDGGVNIYYDADAPDNAYLRGLSYALMGGGFLEADFIPEPSTYAMILVGAGFLLFQARRRLVPRLE